MDFWKFFAIGHANHGFMNPMSEAKLDEMIELMQLPPNGRVLDIACGKAELLIRVARRWGCDGVGVDLSPPFVETARERVADAQLGQPIEIVLGNGADQQTDRASMDLVSCMGASWIWNGHANTLAALADWAKPGGLVLVGEPHWRRPASAEYLAAAGIERDTFGSHESNVRAGLDAGLDFLHTIVSSHDDWDYYEGYQTNAAERYASDNPDDPDVPELLQRIRAARDRYLRWGRDELGWALYLFQVPRRT